MTTENVNDTAGGVGLQRMVRAVKIRILRWLGVEEMIEARVLRLHTEHLFRMADSLAQIGLTVTAGGEIKTDGIRAGFMDRLDRLERKIESPNGPDEQRGANT
jgi:hypothetical protein